MSYYKQAILMMVHKDFDQVENLIRCLDYEGFDIYLHVDAKVLDVPVEMLRGAALVSQVKFVDRIEVNWGGASQIECELELIDSALRGGNYSMLHLITGQDLPLHPAEEIWRWFDERREYEFVGFSHCEPRADITDDERQRWCTYNFFTEKGQSTFWSKLRSALSRVQYILGVDRTRGSGLTFGKGSAYFSISSDFASWLMERERLVRSYFCVRSLCCDEVFMQTMLLSSPFVDRLWDPDGDEFSQSARLIDWKRAEGSSPHTWRIEDFEILTHAHDRMFARKFDFAVDPKVIAQLSARILHE